MDKKAVVVGLLVCMYGLMIIEDNSYSHPIYGFGVPKDQGEVLVGLGLVLMAYGLLKKTKTQERLDPVEQTRAPTLDFGFDKRELLPTARRTDDLRTHS